MYERRYFWLHFHWNPWAGSPTSSEAVNHCSTLTNFNSDGGSISHIIFDECTLPLPREIATAIHSLWGLLPILAISLLPRPTFIPYQQHLRTTTTFQSETILNKLQITALLSVSKLYPLTMSSQPHNGQHKLQPKYPHHNEQKEYSAIKDQKCFFYYMLALCEEYQVYCFGKVEKANESCSSCKVTISLSPNSHHALPVYRWILTRTRWYSCQFLRESCLKMGSIGTRLTHWRCEKWARLCNQKAARQMLMDPRMALKSRKSRAWHRIYTTFNTNAHKRNSAQVMYPLLQDVD